jgi:hypothetical protein
MNVRDACGVRDAVLPASTEDLIDWIIRSQESLSRNSAPATPAPAAQRHAQQSVSAAAASEVNQQRRCRFERVSVPPDRLLADTSCRNNDDY